jgi:hypothetical protein
MDVVQEASDYLLTMTFRDEGNNLVTPSAGKYRIDNVGGNQITGNNANAWVAFTPSGNTHDIIITGNQNVMANANNSREERVVTVEFTYGANSYNQTGEYRYMLNNLSYF